MLLNQVFANVRELSTHGRQCSGNTQPSGRNAMTSAGILARLQIWLTAEASAWGQRGLPRLCPGAAELTQSTTRNRPWH